MDQDCEATILKKLDCTLVILPEVTGYTKWTLQIGRSPLESWILELFCPTVPSQPSLKKPGRRSWCTPRIQLAAVYTETSLQLARKVFPSPVVWLVELVPPRAQLPWKEWPRLNISEARWWWGAWWGYPGSWPSQQLPRLADHGPAVAIIISTVGMEKVHNSIHQTFGAQQQLLVLAQQFFGNILRGENFSLRNWKCRE